MNALTLGIWNGQPKISVMVGSLEGKAANRASSWSWGDPDGAFRAGIHRRSALASIGGIKSLPRSRSMAFTSHFLRRQQIYCSDQPVCCNRIRRHGDKR